MIVVIQCAATKQPTAGHMRTTDAAPVMFVADPQLAPSSTEFSYARPDDKSDQGTTWRELLVRYNDTPDANPWGLLPAVELYANAIYRRLAANVGVDRLFILSAGWGLLKASFLTPAYDITFSQAAEKYKRRGKGDRFSDFRMLPLDSSDPILFFGGRDYVPLFVALTEGVKGSRVVFHNSISPPMAAGCVLQRFETRTRTNWHYECAAAYDDGRVSISGGS